MGRGAGVSIPAAAAAAAVVARQGTAPPPPYPHVECTEALCWSTGGMHVIGPLEPWALFAPSRDSPPPPPPAADLAGDRASGREWGGRCGCRAPQQGALTCPYGIRRQGIVGQMNHESGGGGEQRPYLTAHDADPPPKPLQINPPKEG